MTTRPSRRGKRPTALDVSSGTADPDDSATTSDSTSGRKRDRGEEAGDVDQRRTKRQNHNVIPPAYQHLLTLPSVTPVPKYEPKTYETLETGHLFIFGEEPDPPDDGLKRTRMLSRFVFFDANQDNKLISLDVLEDGMNGDQHILGAGDAVARYELDEDEGQEDDLDEIEPQYIRLSRIHRYFTRYWEADSPFYVETDHAIYELNVLRPSKKYRCHFRPFWRLQTILRFVISSAANDPGQEFPAFLREYNCIEVFDQPLTERELWDAVPKLRKTLETVPYGDDLRASIVIRRLLFHSAPVIFKDANGRNAQEKQKQWSLHDYHPVYRGNLDLAVLREKIPTHVTPRIAQMALPLFRENLQVVGPRPPAEPELPRDELAKRLEGFLMRTQNRRSVQFRPDQRIRRSRWLNHILIDDVKYEIGDTVLFYAGNDFPPSPDHLPLTKTLADYFWFAKIIHMHEVNETVHVQWFEHSSKTFLQELGHSQELFLTNRCDTQNLASIIGTVKTHHIEPGESLAAVKPHDFFCRYLWEDYEGTFTNVNKDALDTFGLEPPPHNCHACDIAAKVDQGLQAEKIHLGMRWHGVDYHLDDCVLIKADDGPCHIGQIHSFVRSREDVKVTVRLFGRTDKIGCRPDAMLKDERHLFFTNDELTTPIKFLIGICYVVAKRDMPDLETWLEMSPNRFYVKYRFPSLNVVSWNDRVRMDWDDLPICPMCLKQDIKKFKGIKMFTEREPPLRVFDPFGGTGAFGLAMEDVGCFKLTHAVEISPSASKTILENSSPDIKVYNQCSNLVLRHAVLTHENKNPEPLKSIEGHELPPPPKPGDIDCLIAGFPCQPHSSLNMYQKANDRKSSLILTALSFVDFLKPSYCIFENVRGFLKYSLRARQDGKHSVKGGIPMGGLKFVAAALLDMGYQLRCALLQAAQYGTPQRRVRFFLIAAKHGLELPPFPQPTHEFPVPDSLEIKFTGEITLRPITTVPGVAPHRYVSAYDAIGDLPSFDWKHPKIALNRLQMNENRIKECCEDKQWCGFSGPDVPYEHEPRTTFQKKCRSRPTRDIQQYTRTYEPKKVERIVEIPVQADADYRSLRHDLWEWQFVNPASATARMGFRPGFYGRVQAEEWFQTTVTNVDPTAKQCRVIHPFSKRIVTVRELARSQGFPDHFVFYAKDDRVVTMHRQIGNAIPWLVSVAIAREFRDTLYTNWLRTNPGPPELAEVEFSEEDEG